MKNSERINYLNHKIYDLMNLMKEILIYEYKELRSRNDEINYLSCRLPLFSTSYNYTIYIVYHS